MKRAAKRPPLTIVRANCKASRAAPSQGLPSPEWPTLSDHLREFPAFDGTVNLVISDYTPGRVGEPNAVPVLQVFVARGDDSEELLEDLLALARKHLSHRAPKISRVRPILLS